MPDRAAWICHGDHPGVDLPISVKKGERCDACGASESSAASNRDSLVLLVSDALAFTADLTPRGQGVLVGALRHAATKPVTEDDEVTWFKAMLDAGLQTTAAFDPEMARSVLGVPNSDAAFLCSADDVDESAGLADLEPDPDAQRDWARDTQAIDESRRDGEDAQTHKGMG